MKEQIALIMDKLKLKYPTTISKGNTELKFVGPMECKGSITEDGKRYLVDII